MVEWRAQPEIHCQGGTKEEHPQQISLAACRRAGAKGQDHVEFALELDRVVDTSRTLYDASAGGTKNGRADYMHGIILEGEEAVVERQRLLKDGKEIPMVVRVRDSRGRKKTTWLHLGMCPSTAWAFCREEVEGLEPWVLLEGVLAHEAGELFGGYLERMRMRQCLVDPSPLSAELVEIDPCIKDVIADLEAKLGIRMEA
jgi:hypothetical protein